VDEKSKRVRRENQARQRAHYRWYRLAGAAALILVGILFSTRRANEKDVSGFKATKEEIELVNNLFSQMNPDRPESSYMPAFMKEKLAWLFAEMEAKRLNVDYDLALEWPQVREALLVSTYSNGQPTLVIILDRLLLYLKVDGKLPESIGRTQRNSFAAALVHEAIHLEKDEAWFRGPARNPEERLLEEFRAYARVDELIITPFLNMGEPVHQTHRDIHSILVGCKYQMPCSAFVDSVTFQNK
jgi:hypothetical protein